MKVNDYVKILSTVLIILGYNNDGYSTVVQQPGPNGTAQVQQQAQSGVPTNLQQTNELKTEFRVKEDTVSSNLRAEFNLISVLINNAFHNGYNAAQSNKLKNNIEQFLTTKLVYDNCDDKSASEYSSAVDKLKQQLAEYINGCKSLMEQDSNSKISKIQHYTLYNKQTLEQLCNSITTFSNNLSNSINELYSQFAHQINQESGFRQQESEISSALREQFNSITNTMNSIKNVTKNVTLINNIEQFLNNELLYDNCNSESAAKYYSAVTELKKALTTYINECKSLTESEKKNDKCKITLYDANQLEILYEHISEFSDSLDDSIKTLYPTSNDQNINTEFIEKRDTIFNEFKNKLSEIEVMMNKSFHLGKYKKENSELANNIKTFLNNRTQYTDFDPNSSQVYSDKVKEIQQHLANYITLCDSLIKSNTGKGSKAYWYYNSTNLNNLMAHINQFSTVLGDSINKLYQK